MFKQIILHNVGFECPHQVIVSAVADPGGARGTWHLGPVKISHKNMATDGGHIDFMFLASPFPAAGSATDP